jgi:hypothetical protein
MRIILRWIGSFLLLIVSLSAQAQSGFILQEVWSNINPATGLPSDYVLNTCGVKLFGTIIRSYNFADYDQVDFEHNGQIITYLPSDLQAFGLESGMFFISKKLPGSEVLEFVQVVLSGRLQLNSRKGNYYLDNGTDIQELRSFYSVQNNPGTPRKRNIKLYISILKINTAGACGAALVDMIERSQRNEQDFIRILAQYHSCENLPFQIHVEKVPFSRLSPIIAVGVGTPVINTLSSDLGTASQIDNPLAFHVYGGLRFHSFRKSPRMSLDVGVEYTSMTSTWQISQPTSNRLMTGSQEFNQRSVYIPFGVNYSVLKKNGIDLYVGVLAGLMLNKIESSVGQVDYTFFDLKETQLLERSFLEINRSVFLPGVKVGVNYPVNKRNSFFAEVQGTLAKPLYSVNVLGFTKAEYSAMAVSLRIGFKL